MIPSELDFCFPISLDDIYIYLLATDVFLSLHLTHLTVSDHIITSGQ